MGLSLLLLISKVAALTILGIIAAVLFIVLMVLFVPFGYRVYAEKYDAFSGSAVISWLFGIIKLIIEKDSCGQNSYARILGVKIRSKKEQPTAEETTIELSKPSAVSTDAAGSKSEGLAQAENVSTASSNQTKEAQFSSADNDEKTNKASEHYGASKNAKRKKKEKKHSRLKKDSSAFTVEQIWELENKGEIIRACMLLLKRLLRIVFSMKVCADVKFGAGEPHTTGYLLGACYAASSIAGIKINADGDFENRTLSGRAEIRGRIFICAIIWAIILFALNKNIFKLIKKYIFKKG